MRMSDWSSDVCSSDLPGAAALGGGQRRVDDARRGAAIGGQVTHSGEIGQHRDEHERARGAEADMPAEPRREQPAHQRPGDRADIDAGGKDRIALRPPRFLGRGRSEEHTSELQSLMRISYAVFCLKKKINFTRHDYRSKEPTYNPQS